MKKNLIAISALMVLSQSAFALPTIYPTTITNLSSIKNRTNSNLVADNVDMKVIYVMPPNSASSIVTGLHTTNANVGFCKEMAGAQEHSKTLSDRIAQLDIEQTRVDTENQAIADKLSKARATLADYATTANLQELIDIDNRIEANEFKNTELTNILMSCTQNCQSVKDDLRVLRNEKMELTKRRRELAALHTKDIREFERKKTAIAGLQADLNDRIEASSRISARIKGVKEDFIKMYSQFGGMEGGRASLSFKSNWDENIESLRAENPDFDFKKISTQKAVITTSIVDLSAIPTGGAIMGYDIGGSYNDGKLTMPAYPENLSGNIRLSLLGACPLLHPEDFNITMPNSINEMKYGMTVSYEYPSAFIAEATVKYNMHKMYQKIMSSGSKGGFFSSRSWTSVEERTFFSDSFVVDWLEQDSGNSLSNDEKANLEREMRNNILSRLATIGLPVVANAGALVLPSGAPKTGAMVLSDSLKSTCPGNYYCVGASIALDVLQSVFGSSSTSASYTNVQDVDMKEKWSRTQIVYKPWISSYN